MNNNRPADKRNFLYFYQETFKHFQFIYMELLQFNTRLTSDSEIKIPENLKTKIEINKEVKIVVIPANEKLYDDWQEDEWNKLSLLNEDEPE